MKNLFDRNQANEMIARIDNLTNETQPNWGKMNVAQMLAHSCVAYQMVYEEENYPKATGFKRFMLKLFLKNLVCNEKPYKKNSRTAPHFLITDERIFETEKSKLIGFINKTQELGASHFEGKESNSFGALNSTEWNNSFSKHLDHHLTQFGV